MLDPSAILLTDRVAVVTGGGAGIGAGIAETFAAHGARVVVAERDEERCRAVVTAIEKRGGTALGQVVDVETEAGVETLARATLDAFGRVDLLVNNVGHYLRAKPFVRTEPADWDALYSVNLKHVFACTRAFVPRMIEQGEGGGIINVSTIEAFRGIPNCAVYSAFNAGITGFTKSLALELGPFRIRVNAIAPETTDTPQVPVSQMLSEERRPMLDYLTPLGRFGTPDDHAGAALFLASDLSSWVTGTTLHVDGGALAAGGFYRDQDSKRWTNMPIVRGAANAP